MTKRYRLTTRAQMHGEVREPGYIFALAEGEVGPHRTVSPRPDVNIADHLGGANQLTDEPMYVELSEHENATLDEMEGKRIAEADAHAEATRMDRALPQHEPAPEPEPMASVDDGPAGDDKPGGDMTADKKSGE